MVGSGGDGRGGGGAGACTGTGGSSSKEAAGMLALHEALRNVCLGSDWTYSVFWTIRPRPRCRGGNGCKVGDDNGSLMLMWEDGFCRPRVEDVVVVGGEDAVQKAFSKMSIQLYNYGEGLMGKVASDKCHKWVFKEPSECEPNISNYWQSSFDAIPPEWNDQFASGIQTIAVIQAGHGLLQLGSCKIIPEDLHFVLRMRYMFESLGYQSGFFLSQLFSSTRNAASPSSSAVSVKQSPPSVFNLGHPSPPAPIHAHTPFHPAAQLGFLPPPSDGQMDAIMAAEHDADLKWPNGMSFFTALTGRADDAKLLFSSPPPASQHPLAQEEHDMMKKQGRRGGNGGAECEPGRGKRTEINGKFKRSFTMPARMTATSPAAAAPTVEQYHALTPQPMDFRSSEAGIYQDIMETFLD